MAPTPAVYAFVLTLTLACSALPPGRYQGGPLPRSARVDRLVVYKSAGTLEAWWRGTLLKSYRVAVGSGGAGPKVYEGDRRTPEGRYRVDGRHRSKRFYRFLHVSYPNADDRRRFRAARGLPAGVEIGGDIGVHGEHPSPLVPATAIDWTAGCIAVSNASIEELYRAVVPDAEIVIRP